MINQDFGQLKHPFSKRKLNVTDRYRSVVDIICQACSASSRPNVTLVEPDGGTVKQYVVVDCNECDQSSWYVVLSK